MVRVDGHHLKLYSEYWTTLSRDGEGRGFWVRWFGWRGGSVGRWFGWRGEKQISPLRCAPVEMTMF
jgi:hypothetical protein